MRLLLDMCAGGRLAEWLVSQGHDVVSVRDRDPSMTDKDILAWAYSEGRVVITIDKGFGKLAVALGQPHRGILRLPDVPADERRRLTAHALALHARELESGALVIVTGSSIRVRRS